MDSMREAEYALMRLESASVIAKMYPWSDSGCWSPCLLKRISVIKLLRLRSFWALRVAPGALYICPRSALDIGIVAVG